MNPIEIKSGDQFNWNGIECTVIVPYEMSVLCVRTGSSSGKFGVTFTPFEQFTSKVLKPDCEVCAETVDEVYHCEICDRLIGSCCSAEYNQFTQIDYNCCKSCAERNDE